jgi:hypothetical protein
MANQNEIIVHLSDSANYLRRYELRHWVKMFANKPVLTIKKGNFYETLTQPFFSHFRNQ